MNNHHQFSAKKTIEKGGTASAIGAIGVAIEAVVKGRLGVDLPDGAVTVIVTTIITAGLNAWKHRNQSRTAARRFK